MLQPPSLICIVPTVQLDQPKYEHFLATVNNEIHTPFIT